MDIAHNWHYSFVMPISRPQFGLRAVVAALVALAIGTVACTSEPDARVPPDAPIPSCSDVQSCTRSICRPVEGQPDECACEGGFVCVKDEAP